jgi:two-component system phosphate regulon sensor histidine kinase PhoR
MGFLVILTLLLAGLGLFLLLDRKVVRPVRRLHELITALAAGKSIGGYIPGGWLEIPSMVSDLERIDTRIRGMEAAAAMERSNFEATMASMVEGFMVVDADHVITQANQALVRMFQLRHPPVGGTVLSVLRHLEVEKLIHASLQSQEPRSGEIRIEHAAGGERQVFEVTVAPLVTSHRGLVGAVTVFHDISRIKQLEEIRREFVANVSHELRTPLAIFRGYLETMLHADMSEEERRRVLHAMDRNSVRLNALVDDLLTLARLESGRAPVEPVLVNLGAFLSGLAADWEKPAAAKSCRVRICRDPAVGAIEADPLRLSQVFNNLLDNALKYSSKGGDVEVGVVPRQDGKAVRFYVKDSGTGIASDKLPHIFERFYRVDRARSRDVGGTGLGLSIVKHIVQAHGGAVGAESEPGEGTTVWFTLPATSADSAPEEPRDP